MTIILTNRFWNNIPITQKTDTQTGVTTLHSTSDALLATGAGKSSTGDVPGWTINDLDTFTRLYNNANDPDITSKEFSNLFYNKGVDSFNRDRGDVLNNDNNYPDIPTADSSQNAFYDNKIPYVINPKSGSTVNSKGKQTKVNTFSSEQTNVRKGSNYRNTSTVSKPNEVLLMRTSDRYNTPVVASTYSGSLRYPEKMPGDSDHIVIAAHDYNGAVSGGGFQGLVDNQRLGPFLGSVTLPIQGNISDESGVSFQEGRLNAIQGAFAAGAAAGIEGLGNADLSAAATGMVESITEDAKKLLNDSGNAEFLKYYFAGQAVGADGLVTRATGKILNQNLELLFNGPQLRSFDFGFALSPRSESEARTVKSIISFFKRHMAVQRSGSTLFLETPDIFQIKYMYQGGEHPFINKIKPCALTAFRVNYTPGQYMTYKDGSMTSYALTMKFQELKPIYRDDQESAISAGGIGY